MDLAATETAIRTALEHEAPDVERAFVVLWLYCEANRVRVLAAQSDAASTPLLSVELADDSVLAHLRALDRTVSELEPTGRIFDVDEKGWFLVRRTIYASVFGDATWDGTGASSLASVARSMTVVPASVAGIALEPASIAHHAESAVDGLRSATTKERAACGALLQPSPKFTIGVWPLSTWPFAEGEGDAHPIVLARRDPNTADALAAELTSAVAWAAEKRVHVLVLPELMLDLDAAVLLQDAIRSAGGDAPALCVVGLCHRPVAVGPNTKSVPGTKNRWLNDAIVLGPQGGVLWTHRKFDPVTVGKRAERLEPGTRLRVVETPIGHFGLAICKDLIGSFQERYLKSGAEWLLVPSMSASTGAHRNAAQTLTARQLTSTIVANRPFGPAAGPDTWGSFVRLPGRSGDSAKAGEVNHDAHAPGEPALLVTLDKFK